MMKPKIAILQNVISNGGRLSVVARIIKNLNDIGIKPDLITGKSNFQIKDVESFFGYSIKVNLIDLNTYSKHFPELHILRFNKYVSTFCKDYDIVINSSNTSHFLDHANLMEYVHYPRYDRILKESVKNTRGLARIIKYLENGIVRRRYKTSNYPSGTVYANSEYTRQVFEENYPNYNVAGVLYPPISIPKKSPSFKKGRNIVSLGRFHPSKKQLDTIKLARFLPEFHFNIIGFSNESDKYYTECAEYIQTNNLKHVSLHKNVSLHEKEVLLNQASFFIHLLEDEPFGISTVQGISNGCIPVVPNSGGQKEIVIYPELRFSNNEDIPKIITETHKKSESQLHSIAQSLFNHIKQYDSKQFDLQFQEILKIHVSK